MMQKSSESDFSNQRRLGSAKRLRDEAVNLRKKVSKGGYTDEDLQAFWLIIGSAGRILAIPDSEFARRAGVGDTYFTEVVRERRRPKLNNFLSALTAVIAVADEQSLEGEQTELRDSIRMPNSTGLSIQENWRELFLLATSLSHIAEQEVARLEAQRPNEPLAIRQNEADRKLLSMFAHGFDRIASALGAIAEVPSDAQLSRQAAKIVRRVANEIEAWWKNNGEEFADWSMRLPILTAGVAALNLAGANMHLGTATVAALVGGPKVMRILREGLKGDE